MQDEKVFTDLFEAMATDLLQKIESGEATAADLSVARAVPDGIGALDISSRGRVGQ